jgi:hypothetical protein
MDVPSGLRDWLHEAEDPSVRFRALTEVFDRPRDDPEVVRAARQIGQEGWAAEILNEQLPEGQWDSPGVSGRHLYRPKYISTNWRLIVLADLGAPRSHPGIAKAIDVFMAGFGGPEGDFGGTGSEHCFTGNALRLLTRFGYGKEPAAIGCLEWLLKTQKADGGWHCFESETGTLDCWEALAAFAAMPRDTWTDRIRSAVAAGAEFYLKRGLLDEGEPYAPWLRLHYPVHYYYDVLVGLDALTSLGYAKDPRLGPALDLLESKRNADGSWNVDLSHPDIAPENEYQLSGPYYPFVLETPGRRSYWITLNALAVLRRAGRL